jgi:hypothetical protein
MNRRPFGRYRCRLKDVTRWKVVGYSLEYTKIPKVFFKYITGETSAGQQRE